MSADLHIHVYEGLTKDDLRRFFSHTMGSKWFTLSNLWTPEEHQESFNKVMDSPDVWVGSVSWLKAALLEDGDKYIPSPVMEVSEIVGEELPMIDDELIGQIREALALENTTSYSVASPEAVVAFLEEHRGKRVFTVSW